MSKIICAIYLVISIAIGNCEESRGIFDDLFNSYNGFLQNFDSPQIDDENNILQEYDFVIIGAGSGGSVLANRLTEIPEWNVLLIEAGKDEIFLTDVPLLAPTLHITAYNWGYKTEPGFPDENGNGGFCLGMKEGRCNWPRGKAVGGSSVVNYMMYTRGSKSDYDSWAAQGNPGWSYEEVLPYFRKSENNQIDCLDVRYHGKSGYLDVNYSPYVSKLRDLFLNSAEEMGYKINDYNAERLLGFSVAQANLRGGRRVSASKAFLRPIRNRRNFHVSKYSRVTRIVIDPVTRIATGVEFVKNKRKYFVRASKEVLLCAGALNSPQLLMLSGIGPRDHLESLGIPVFQDLPVGYNLQDHVSMSILTFLVNDSVTIIESRVATNPANTFDYLVRGTGPLTVPGGAEGLAFINTKKGLKTSTKWGRKIGNSVFDNYGEFANEYEDDYADIELVLGLGSLTGDTSGGLKGIMGLSDELVNDVFHEYEGRDGFSLVPIVLHPKSRGRVTLKSSNPFHWPVLQANYYQDPDDLETIVRGIKKAIEVAATTPFKKYNTTLLPLNIAGCRHITFNTDPYWACVARHVSTTLGHLVGTCKMAPIEDSGVVDATLKVYGIRNLRVVDASIMPTIIAGHTNAPAIMIGEKASDMIKLDWQGFI